MSLPSLQIQYLELVCENFFFVATPDSDSEGEDGEKDDTDQDLRDLFDDIYPDEELASPIPSPTSPNLKKHMMSSDDSPVQLHRSRCVAAKIEMSSSSSSSSSSASRPVSRWARSKDNTLTTPESSSDIQSPESVVVTSTRPGDTPPPLQP